MPLRIQFFHMGMSHPDARLRFMGVYEAQFRGLREAGALVRFSPDVLDDDSDIIISSASSGDIEALLQRTTRPVILYAAPTDQWFDVELLRRLKPRLLFVYGTWESADFRGQYQGMGIAYHTIPFGADPDLMKPLHLPRLFDVCFVGGVQHRRNWRGYIEPLVARLPPERLLLLGAGYERFGIPAQAIAYGPLLNVVYNLARVCVNFHSAEQKRGMETQLDLNNRVFDLAMAGTVQVCDNVAALRPQFDQAEIIGAEDSGDWVARVFELLARPEAELDGMRHAARRRAVRDHSWRKRGETLLGLIHGSLT